MLDSRADSLVAAARAGDERSLARLVSLVEDGASGPRSGALGPVLRTVLRAVAPHTGGAWIIGLTGSPGVGKSTVTNRLVRAYRAGGRRVAVLAVDPTSPFSGGALLGDRVRMNDHATDPGVFIRSMATRGHLGGLSWATPQALHVLDAAGFDVICVETVGVGQAEVEIAGLADSTLVVMAPGLGDSIQTAKAGIVEIADVFVVNKSDRPGAHDVVRDLRMMLAMAGSGSGSGEEGAGAGAAGAGAARAFRAWKPPIVSVTATTGEGIEELTARLDAHWAWLGESGLRQERRVGRAREEISAIAVAEIRRKVGGLPGPGESRLDELAAQVVGGKLDPYSAADELIAG